MKSEMYVLRDVLASTERISKYSLEDIELACNKMGIPLKDDKGDYKTVNIIFNEILKNWEE